MSSKQLVGGLDPEKKSLNTKRSNKLGGETLWAYRVEKCVAKTSAALLVPHSWKDLGDG